MGKKQYVFDRHEKKFLLSAHRYDRFMRSLEGMVLPDSYGQYTISSIYFDTPNYDIIRHSVSKPVFKEKLRMRCYGTPAQSDPVFLELKRKLDGIVYKRRAEMTLREAEEFMNEGIYPKKQNQVTEEIAAFMTRFNPQKSVMICYDRTAYTSPSEPGLRITFDFDIRWRERQLDLSKGSFGTALLNGGECLMEIKTGCSFPLWLCEALSDSQIYPVSFSKYGTIYKTKLSNRTTANKLFIFPERKDGHKYVG